jgi:hypothetical protein
MTHAILLQRKPQVATLEDLFRPLMQPWADAYENWTTSLKGTAKPAKQSGECRCARCCKNDCSCRCCVAEADLLVETRLGERRIVPIVIENSWRREREIELELSSWTKAGAFAVVHAQLLSPASFKIAPCDEAHVILAIEIKNEAGTSRDQKQLGDVDGCTVSYADLRVKGCDIRTIRIAVAVLPRSCDAYHVDCNCACC